MIDADGNIVPTGGLGELCIGGETLARGYLNRASLTAERFVPDPQGDGARLYRSGDLCRQRADGVFEFLGRLDQQVKLRGHRIELGEIEVALRRCAGVREAVVELRGEGDRRGLVGYVVGDADPADLRAQLQERLPDYMVPALLMPIPSLPLNANGKIDRKALPEPQFADRAEYEAPQGEIETAIAGVWADLLPAERIGRHDNFFELGGHSIALLRVQSGIQSKFAVELSLSTFFEQPTLAALSRTVSRQRARAMEKENAELGEMSSLLASLET